MELKRHTSVEERVKDVKLVDSLLREEEDDYFMTWIALGLPDDTDDEELLDWMSDDEDNYEEWMSLAERLLTGRGE